MFFINRVHFLPPPLPKIAGDEAVGQPSASAPATLRSSPAISLLIPARNEEASIAAAVQAALQSRLVSIEVVVLDDHSEDQTAVRVADLVRSDGRVRLLTSPALPEGWNGKQHACYHLAREARNDLLVFIDADVRLDPTALIRLDEYRRQRGTALLSAFPHQRTETWLERWIIPLMHFILLGFLPLKRMRRSSDPAYAAGCGQLFMTTRDEYEKAGTHAAIRASRHDGLKLPRAYRHAGLSTDVVDGTPLATCRMYSTAAEVIRGVLKNATEGIANPKLIVPFSILLIGGAIVPWVSLTLAMIHGHTLATALSLMALLLSHLPRVMAARQFRQPWQSVAFHTPAIGLFVALQWIALINHLRGRPIRWRGRL